MVSLAVLVPALLVVSSLGTCHGFSVPCWLCEKIMNKIHDDLEHNKTHDFLSFGKFVCELTTITEEMKVEVCTAGVKEFAPVLFEVVKHSDVDTKAICSVMLSRDCGATLTSNWTVPVPGGQQEYVPPQLPKPGSPVVRAIHLADPHIDRFYSPGSLIDCGEPLCCHDWHGPGKAGRWGEISCDAPAALLENLFQHISKSEPVDYVLWTGDLPSHQVWNQTRDNQITVIKDITNMLRRYMPGARIYPAVGNHEGAPVNIFATMKTSPQFSDQWLYDLLADLWQDWLPDYALETVRHGGFYSVPHSATLRIISLNFNFCNTLNFWLYANDTDPTGQLAWLVKELVKAEAAGEKVHIVGHIPPGISNCMPRFSAVYNKIVVRFQNIIAAQFYGHTHADELEVFFNSSDPTASEPNNIAYIAPSVTPYMNHFPTYRIYDIDGDYPGSSWAVLDHHNYWCNLTEANLFNEPKWTLEYSAREAYNMTSLFPRDWADFAHRCTTDDKLFATYLQHKYHGPLPQDCDDKCRAKHICHMLTSSSGVTTHCPQ